MYRDIIGVIGGMGSYSTLCFFEQFLKSFSNIEDNERPRIIIDNYCCIPNKIPACLSPNDQDPFVVCLTSSITNLINYGCTKILIVCNITHVLLNTLYKIHPEFKNYIVNILDVLQQKISKDGVKKVILFATDNAIKTKIFEKKLSSVDVIYTNNEKDQAEIKLLMRLCKNTLPSIEVIQRFENLCNKYKSTPIILGCTELSVIYAYTTKTALPQIYDPLSETVAFLHDNII